MSLLVRALVLTRGPEFKSSVTIPEFASQQPRSRLNERLCLKGHRVTLPDIILWSPDFRV